MLLSLALGVALLQQGSWPTDTTVAVASGTRLALSLAGGEVTIRSWDRGEVRIRARHSSRTLVDIRHDGAVLRIHPRGRMGMAGDTDFELTVPAWLAGEVEGMYLDLDAEGVQGALKASTLNGDLRIRRGGPLDLTAINGDIRVEGASGRIRLSAVSGRIIAAGVQGEVSAEAVSGDIRLTGVESSRVEAEAVSGNVVYEGTVRDGGSYVLASHSGAVYFALPPGANASIQTSSYSGGVSASFPLPAQAEGSRRRSVLRFGSGSASVELESFSGSLRLVRPGELPPEGTRRPPRTPRPPRPPGDSPEWMDLEDFDFSGVGEALRGLEVGLSVGLGHLRHLGREVRLDLRHDLRNELRREWPRVRIPDHHTH